ncbi:MAG: chloride channel protein [Ignavibacteriae bacterium]|nr:chloride channel protein [Ignavibacteriota bacterium]
MFRRQIAEHTFLFLGIIKWVFWATFAGVVVGGVTTGFLKLLDWGIATGESSGYLLFLIPIGLFLSGLIIKYLAPDAEGHGTEKVLEAVHKKYGKIKAAVVPVKIIATVITLSTGGSAGKEGPSAQIGAGVTSIMADIFRFSNVDRRKLVICGISAGFAAVFGTPIAGAIFGVEVLFVGNILYSVMLPSFIAGIVSYQVAVALGMHYSYHPLYFVPVFSESFLLQVILSGVFFGLVSALFIEILRGGEKLAAKIKIWKPLKGLIGGALLIGIALIFSEKYLGLGIPVIDSTLRGENIEWYAFLIKSFATTVTFISGGSGGVITPILFVGSTSGALFGSVMGLDIATFAAIGLVAVLSGTTNAPIAASIMSVELFGPQVAPYATLACVVSFLMTGSRSVYPSQILSMDKSASTKSQIGKEMDKVETNFDAETRRQMARIRRMARKIPYVKEIDVDTLAKTIRKRKTRKRKPGGEDENNSGEQE